MKRWIIPLLLMLAAACSPQTYTLHLDVRQPSSSGLDLSRKSMAVVYMDGKAPADSAFDRAAASAMAQSLEADYFGGEPVVPLFHVPYTDSVTVEQMHALVMDTEGDVIFLLSSQLELPENPAAEIKVPLSTSLSVYDSMGKDKVHRFSGKAKLIVGNAEDLQESARKVGEHVARRFVSGWKTENFSFYWFDDLNEEQWLDALQHAADGNFALAIDGWGALLKQKSAQKRACACYNIAMAFYLLEDDALATRWLDLADRLEDLSLSAGLRSRIALRLEKLQ